MSNLAKREMFDELFDFRRNFDHIFHRFLSGSGPSEDRVARMFSEVPPIEAWVDKENKKYHLRIALPGIDPKDLKVEVQGSRLTISGQHQSSEEKKEGEYLQQEFSYGQFQRSVVLPEGSDMSKLNAEYNNGVLEISAPLSEAALPKQIEVKTAAKTKGVGA